MPHIILNLIFTALLGYNIFFSEPDSDIQTGEIGPKDEMAAHIITLSVIGLAAVNIIALFQAL